MQSEKEESMKEAKISIWRLLQAKQYRRQLFVALMLHLSQQFSGINAVRKKPAHNKTLYLFSDITFNLMLLGSTLSLFNISESNESNKKKRISESVKWVVIPVSHSFLFWFYISLYLFFYWPHHCNSCFIAAVKQ